MYYLTTLKEGYMDYIYDYYNNNVRIDDFVNAKFVGGDGPSWEDAPNVDDDFLDSIAIEVL